MNRRENQKPTKKWYRLALYNPNGGAEIINFERLSVAEAIDHASSIYHNQAHHYGAQLYQYNRLDTSGSFSFVAKIKEPTADE